ncbi:hypothetical protein JB92DRAFT_3111958 [Gautieria morchelliformis]|nr:hypothetical protein JB92DRAFT_3111958 [Gautieria morchelliformis]
MPSVKWTLDEPHNAQMTSSWDTNYYSETSGPQNGPMVTEFIAEKNHKRSVVAWIEWDRAGGPGQVCIGRQLSPLSGFLGLDSVPPPGFPSAPVYGSFTRQFTLPPGIQLKVNIGSPLLEIP